MILKGFARLVIEIIGDQEGIQPPNDKRHQKDLPLETFRFVVFPAGIENSSQDEEKQHLTDAPQHPFQLQGMASEYQTDGDEGQQIQPNADKADMSEQFASHLELEYASVALLAFFSGLTQEF